MSSTTGRITGNITGSTNRLPHQGISRPPCFPDVLAWHTGQVRDDILLRDLAPALGPYPLQMIDGPCLRFNGVDEYGTFDTITLVGNFTIYWEEEFAVWGTQERVLSNVSASTSFRHGFGQNVLLISFNSIIYTISFSIAIPVDTPHLFTVVRTGDQLSVTRRDTGETKVVTCNVGDVEFSQLSDSSSFDGKLWNICLSDSTQTTLFPCIGKTNTVNPTSTFATDGTEMTIVSSDYAAIWAGVQQTIFHEVQNGYWEDVNGRYPYAHPGATRVDAGWNYPQNGFKYQDPVPQAIIDADPDNVWVAIGGLANTLTQEEIEANAFINTNDQDFFGAKDGLPKQLTKYVNAQTGDCLVRAKEFHGI